MKLRNQVSILALATASMIGGAYGQETAVQPSVPQANGTVAELEQVIITGSRIARKDYSSPSPVATIDSEFIHVGGSIELEDALNQLPQFLEGATSQTNAIGGGGGATLNLRALGATRNLVLLDGRRLPASSAFGEVDINILPSSLIRNVEVLTGGASSVYGSEAISGVVNFQSKLAFEGLILDAQYGGSFEGGAEKADVSLLGGAKSDDGRARAVVSLGYTDRNALRGSSRDFFSFAVPSSFISQGTFRSGGNAPSQAAVNAVFAAQGITAQARTDQLGFNDDGSLFSQFGGALNYKGPTNEENPLFWVRNGTDVVMPVGQQGVLIKPLERYTAFGKFEYDVTDSITAYTQILYADSTTRGSAGLNITLNGPPALVPVTNPFIPDDLATLLASRPDPDAPFILNKRFESIGERTFDEQFITAQYLVGMKGDIGFKDWTFDIYAARDSVNATETNENTLLASRLNAVLAAPDGGASLCAGGFNPFGRAASAAISTECQDFLAPDTVSTLDTRRNAVEGTVTGSIFALPAGDVQFSLTLDYREDKLNFIPNLSIQSDDVLGRLPSLPSRGRTETKEASGELYLPLLRDKPLIESLGLSLGYRLSDHNVAGTNSSWKVGLEWQSLETLQVRGSVQRAIRAPNIGELFSTAVGSQVTVGNPPSGGDPCDVRTTFRSGSDAAAIRDLCLAQGITPAQVDGFTHTTTSVPTLSGGNDALTPEKADSYTIGFVWQPDMGDNDLSFTVDWWSIDIKDVINVVNGNDALSKCFSATSNPTFSNDNQFCQLITRETATGTVDFISTDFLNLGGIKTSGIDVAVDGAFDVGPGRLRINAAATWLNAYKEQSLPGEPFLDFTGSVEGPANRVADNNVHPEWSILVTPTYEMGPASVSLRWRRLSKMKDRDLVFDANSATPGVPSFNYLDLSGTWAMNQDIMFRAGITNLTDKSPPIVGGGLGDTRAGTYDIIGRSFFVGVNSAF